MCRFALLALSPDELQLMLYEALNYYKKKTDIKFIQKYPV